MMEIKEIADVVTPQKAYKKANIEITETEKGCELLGSEGAD